MVVVAYMASGVVLAVMVGLVVFVLFSVWFEISEDLGSPLQAGFSKELEGATNSSKTLD